MSTEALRQATHLSRFEQLRYAQEILRIEGQAVVDLSIRLTDDFCDAVKQILDCQGSVLVTGMGKAGLVGQKITATLASTGTSSHFLHPAEAVHGDLGRVQARDVILALSFSGETDEMIRLLPSFAAMKVPIVVITAKADSTLARAAQVVLELGPLREVCCLGLAPSTSTTVMLALGDALALVASRMRDFRHEDFARFHPGGSLGRKLATVDEVMRPLEACRVAQQCHSVRQVIVQVSRPGRRTGAIMLVDPAGRLTGLFTDSDLARILEEKRDAALDLPIGQVMTRHPMTIKPDARLIHAVEILSAKKFSELPVVDTDGLPVGILDVTDIVGLGALVDDTGHLHDTEHDNQPVDTIPFHS